MRVLLVSCYELGHQPVQLASAAAFLRQAGHAVDAVDLAVEPLDDARLAACELVAVSVPMHTAMRLAQRVVERVRSVRGDGVVVVLFGLYAPLCRDALPGLVDHVVGGEVEGELVRIAGGAPSGRAVVLDRLHFPVPARDVLPPLDRYAHLLAGGERRPVGYVEASRGCVHRCRHCPVPAVYDGRIRVVQRDVLLADIDRLHVMGARHLTFGDPDFLNAPPHALAVVRAVHARHPDLTFDITTKVEHVLEHAALWPELRTLGLLFVVTAVESTSDRVLALLAKGHTHADTLAALRVLRAAGIEVRPSFLPFTPWSSLRDLLDLLDLVADEDLAAAVDPVQLGIRLLVPEGSLLLSLPEMREHLEGRDPTTLTHRWRHPDPAMDVLQERIATLVARDADAGVDAEVTHRRVRHLAAEAAATAGLEWSVHRAVAVAGAGDRPRLSEPWFC